MEKNEFLVLRYINSFGNNSIREISSSIKLSNGLVHSLRNSLLELGYIDKNGITELGKKELDKYRVNSAVLLAAGLSTRFAPLSFDKPKGLLKVKNEILIERQIKQLKEVGINNIVLVLGYKKESFFYLGEKYNVKILINPSYATKDSSESLFLARNYLSNTYICSSDNYFVTNPFNTYEYEPFAITEMSSYKKEGNFIKRGSKDQIVARTYGYKKDLIYKGMMYWDSDFSVAISNLLVSHHDFGDFDNQSIQSVIFEHLHELPPFYSSLREPNTVFKFYNLDELRKFDEKYVEHTSSTIMKNISKTLGCKESDVKDFLPIKEGLTNTSYTFIVKDVKYVYRHPGEGTEKIINRNSEHKSLQLAKELGIDPSFIKMDPKKGWKISLFIPNSREPDYSNFEDSKLIINKMRELHDKKAPANWYFRPWEDALKMEEIVRKKQKIEMPDFNELKNNIYKIYQAVNNDGLVEKCFCHCDTYKPNWLINKDNNNVVLIDWEYAGYSDPGVDVGYYIVDAMYEPDEALKFIKEYLGDKYNKELEKHFVSYIAIIAYYWFVWALFRESCSAIMGESLYNWYYMAKKYSKYVLGRYI
ncbi:MAG: phosphotransferase [Bacilli bacterium]|nr:phosphotransferase [Bacilli bacterium]